MHGSYCTLPVTCLHISEQTPTICASEFRDLVADLSYGLSILHPFTTGGNAFYQDFNKVYRYLLVGDREIIPLSYVLLE